MARVKTISSGKSLINPGIFDQMEQLVYISDPNSYEILYGNQDLRRLFPGKIIGKKCYKIFQGFDKPCSFCTNDKLFGEKPLSPYIWDYYNKKVDKWFQTTGNSPGR